MLHETTISGVVGFIVYPMRARKNTLVQIGLCLRQGQPELTPEQIGPLLCNDQKVKTFLRRDASGHVTLWRDVPSTGSGNLVRAAHQFARDLRKVGLEVLPTAVPDEFAVQKVLGGMQ